MDDIKLLDTIKLTLDQFEFFKKQIKIWLDILGMTDYHIDIRFEKDENGYAVTQGSFSQRKYWVKLSEEWDNEWVHKTSKEKDKQIEEILIECAHHEAMECFFYRIRNLAEMRYIGDADIDDEIHSMIHKMEGAWGRFMEKKKDLKKYENDY
jgi:hypothetical protein